MRINSKFFHCVLTGIVCILFICSLPVSSFAGYTSNQLSSSTSELNFYQLMDYYNSFNNRNTSYPLNYNYSGAQFQQTSFPCWGIGQTFTSFEFSQYVYIYYPGSLTMLYINSDIVTYKVIKSVYVSNGYTYTTIGFAWYSQYPLNFNNSLNATVDLSTDGSGNTIYKATSTYAGHTKTYYSSPILKPTLVYNYDYSQAGGAVGQGWVAGQGSSSGSTVIQKNGPDNNLRSYDGLLGHIHYIDLFTLKDTTSLSNLFDNFTNYAYDVCDYVSVFCPDVDIESSDFDLNDPDEYNQNDANNFPWIFNNNNNVDYLQPAIYETVYPNGGSISTSQIKNLPGSSSVVATREPLTRPPQTRPDLTSGTETTTATTNPVVSALDDLTGTITNTEEPVYNYGHHDNYDDLNSELGSVVQGLSSRGNDLSSVCGQAEGFFDDVFGALPALLVAVMSCCAICLFIAKVVNR